MQLVAKKVEMTAVMKGIVKVDCLAANLVESMAMHSAALLVASTVVRKVALKVGKMEHLWVWKQIFVMDESRACSMAVWKAAWMAVNLVEERAANSAVESVMRMAGLMVEKRATKKVEDWVAWWGVARVVHSASCSAGEWAVS